MKTPLRCDFCFGTSLVRVYEYCAPPQGEVKFSITQGDYRRELVQCTTCLHFYSCHEIDMTGLYSGEYVQSTYGADGLRKSFERIIQMPREKSDNQARVERVTAYASKLGSSHPRSLLDIGSGLCVFGYEMKRMGWHVSVVDPDLQNVTHALTVAQVDRGFHGEIGKVEGLGMYELISLNKVLEHVSDPVGLLDSASKLLSPGGLMYVELPDGESAFRDSPNREEFFIDHEHVFSFASFALLCQRASLELGRLERIREPSTKYTLCGFLTKPL